MISLAEQSTSRVLLAHWIAANQCFILFKKSPK